MAAIQPQVYFERKTINLRSVLPLDNRLQNQPMEKHAGHLIKDALKAHGKSQTWLAEKVGVSDNAVSKWVKTGKINKDHMPDISRLLFIPIAHLLGEKSLSQDSLPAWASAIISDLSELLPEKRAQFAASIHEAADEARAYKKMVSTTTKGEVQTQQNTAADRPQWTPLRKDGFDDMNKVTDAKKKPGKTTG